MVLNKIAARVGHYIHFAKQLEKWLVKWSEIRMEIHTIKYCTSQSKRWVIIWDTNHPQYGWNAFRVAIATANPKKFHQLKPNKTLRKDSLRTEIFTCCTIIFTTHLQRHLHIKVCEKSYRCVKAVHSPTIFIYVIDWVIACGLSSLAKECTNHSKLYHRSWIYYWCYLFILLAVSRNHNYSTIY